MAVRLRIWCLIRAAFLELVEARADQYIILFWRSLTPECVGPSQTQWMTSVKEKAACKARKGRKFILSRLFIEPTSRNMFWIFKEYIASITETDLV